MRYLAFVAAATAACGHLPALAQSAPAPPNPQTITVPDLSRSSDPDVVSNGWKYFFFQKAGVSFEEAYGDFADCARFLQPNDWGTVKLGRFVPWEAGPAVRPFLIRVPMAWWAR